MNSIFHPGAIVADQYQLLYPLGKGGSGLTYAALDKKTHAHIALKIFNPSRIKDWKKVELFEREARTLKALDHPGIPKYLGYSSFLCQGHTFFAISQELAPGKPLSDWISQGWRPGERTVKQIAAQVLEILSYLQSLIPPVIHRDIKPENIIYFPNTSDQEDRGIIYLVDFGAVQEKLHDATLGSTVVGTFGYIAPEQYRGQAFLSTDLYGLGTTLVYLLTAKHPADLPHHRMKVDFRPSTNLSDGFCSWIEVLIEPSYQDRIPGAADALQVLRGERSLSEVLIREVKRPVYSNIEVYRSPEKLRINIPPAIQRRKNNLIYSLGIIFLFGWYLIVGTSLYLLSSISFSPLLGIAYIVLIIGSYMRECRYISAVLKIILLLIIGSWVLLGDTNYLSHNYSLIQFIYLILLIESISSSLFSSPLSIILSDFFFGVSLDINSSSITLNRVINTRFFSLTQRIKNVYHVLPSWSDFGGVLLMSSHFESVNKQKKIGEEIGNDLAYVAYNFLWLFIGLVLVLSQSYPGGFIVVIGLNLLFSLLYLIPIISIMTYPVKFLLFLAVFVLDIIQDGRMFSYSPAMIASCLMLLDLVFAPRLIQLFGKLLSSPENENRSSELVSRGDFNFVNVGQFISKTTSISFGQSLSRNEKAWLTQEIRSFFVFSRQ